MKAINFINSELYFLSKEDILELFLKNTSDTYGMQHIVSINPENFVCMQRNKLFNNAVTKAQGHIADGVGVVAAVNILYKQRVPHATGVDTLEYLLIAAGERRLRVLLIGGRNKIAEKLVDCYHIKYPTMKIVACEGYENAQAPKKSETSAIFHIVRTVRPHLVFVAFGSPTQEIWIEEHRGEFNGALVMGIGGSFDMLGGAIKRAPYVLRELGLEWVYRLYKQPWRITRQARLLIYIGYIVREYFARLRHSNN